MKIDFVRFNATDGVELQGWLNNESGELAVLHIHGMSGNGYENYFLDYMREMYAKKNISMFTIDTRGRGVISDFRHGAGSKHAGSCFEIFDECLHDIQGAIDYLKSIGKSKFILQGHSLGCTKVVYYLNSVEAINVEKVILLAPTDMVEWAKTDPHHDEYMSEAKRLLALGKGEELVGAECWLDKTPISAQTYPTICEAGSSADIYGDREGGALLGRITLPTLIPYGSADIGITEIDISFENWKAKAERIINTNTHLALIEGAPHGFRDYEEELTAYIEKFV